MKVSEQALVTDLLARAHAAQIHADTTSLIHSYVALKSKPLAVLVGPAGSNKVSFIEAISQAIVGSHPVGFQKMNGHAWWASGTGNVAFFTQIQTRFNTAKLLALIQEALQPENRHQAYMACMAHISPAELLGYFGTLAFQLQHGELIRLPTAHFSAPIPFPPNLLLVGTMDAVCFDGFDLRMLAKTSLLLWPRQAKAPIDPPPDLLARPDVGSAVQHVWVRSATAARFKLSQYFRWPSQALQPIGELIRALRKGGVEFPKTVLEEALIYLANCWADDGPGLFAPSRASNLAIALDMAAVQAVLPHCLRAIAQSRLNAHQAGELLSDHFPRMKALLNQWEPSTP